MCLTPVIRPEGLCSLDISKDGFRAADQSVGKELAGRRRGSRWQTAACGERRAALFVHERSLKQSLGGRMYFVPEGQHDSSQARSAWESVPPKNRPVGYGMIGRSYSHRQRKCFQSSYLKLPHSNHRIGAQHTCTNHTVPYGTALLGWR
jgi:hypothetical protein